MTTHIQPIAIPGIHQRFFKLFQATAARFDKPTVLEVGAGHGAFTQKIWKEGYDVTACDLFPEIYQFEEVPCTRVDITQEFPFPSEAYDLVVAVEVMEHIHDHEVFFGECHRILKKNGVLMVSTPNILSLKSRIRFLFSGFYYSFKPLDHARHDGMQHIASLTIDQYHNLGIRAGFLDFMVDIDKRQNPLPGIASSSHSFAFIAS
ncbi:MAG: class I SAM-dependent methyltransferase [Saprospirales bacterium]|nr:class I SAM-dependent methyltransferase [Saprospirales bacterium]